ncbi:ubiquinone biosynthesis O-methyltransferase-like [Mercenaria mercenaria]|uniref:ubiquinone biosynthesis O-methyltransferase-like n=1 Tax=Mercenaria mercenaria TaxID=6596 RepID=UPI00234EF05C|nr:ubiquinone biosynthesis O-methyltransferase-like [Mercenaria mercenaria]XP_053407330.1 ubiquinone biosynthesis O-methyltransferase-like [Mercenaria mercenaria]
MSKRGDYERISSVYDSARSAVGSDVICGMIQLYTGKPMKDIHVLDVGCGTGNYAKDLIEYGVGHVSLLDASASMLEKAKDKLSGAAVAKKVVDIVEETIPPLPFPDKTFDAVMFNLVLNHLDDENDEEFPTCIEALKEAKRVLGPEGLIIISTVLPSTVQHAVWYTQLNMSMTERYVKRLPSIEQFEYMFKAADVSCIQKMNILGSDLQKKYYYLEGPLDSSWRADHLYWLSSTESELNAVKQKIEELKCMGEYEEWVKRHDHVNTAGFLTIFVCKPKQNI